MSSAFVCFLIGLCLCDIELQESVYALDRVLHCVYVLQTCPPCLSLNSYGLYRITEASSPSTLVLVTVAL